MSPLALCGGAAVIGAALIRAVTFSQVASQAAATSTAAVEPKVSEGDRAKVLAFLKKHPEKIGIEPHETIAAIHEHGDVFDVQISAYMSDYSYLMNAREFQQFLEEAVACAALVSPAPKVSASDRAKVLAFLQKHPEKVGAQPNDKITAIYDSDDYEEYSDFVAQIGDSYAENEQGEFGYFGIDFSAQLFQRFLKKAQANEKN